ncbi:MAG: putative ABC transporter permease [Lachnospiraceae bacterium]|nr:putative ABC transporter permease [Lachnospiraceae bacterium]
MCKVVKPLILFAIGGLLYTLIELLWRGRTHWTMFIVGGICFVLIGLINDEFGWDMPLVKQMAISALLITMFELYVGIALNKGYKLNIWDYSNMPFNLWGQICLPYSILWFLLSLPAIILDDYLRYWFFSEEKPKYKLF